MDVTHNVYLRRFDRSQKLCKSRDGRPGFPVANKPDGFCERKATLKRKPFRQSSEAVRKSRWPSGWVLLYVHRNRRLIRDGSPGRPPQLSHSSRALMAVLDSPVPNSPYGLCGRKATLNLMRFRPYDWRRPFEPDFKRTVSALTVRLKRVRASVSVYRS